MLATLPGTEPELAASAFIRRLLLLVLRLVLVGRLPGGGATFSLEDLEAIGEDGVGEVACLRIQDAGADGSLDKPEVISVKQVVDGHVVETGGVGDLPLLREYPTDNEVDD